MNTSSRIARSAPCIAAGLAVSAHAPQIQAQSERPATAVRAVAPMHPAPVAQPAWALAIESVALNSDGKETRTIDWRNDPCFVRKQALAAVPTAVGARVAQASHGFR